MYSAIPQDFAKSGIYQIVNSIDGKRYVGSAKNIFRRFRDHTKLLRLNKHHNIFLQRAWNKYNGEINFKFQVLEFCSVEQLIEREQYHIDLVLAIKYGYNLRPTANNNTGFKFSKESSEKLSKAKKGFKHTEEAKEKMRFKKPEMSERMKGNKYRTGYKYSEEEKIKLRNQPRKIDKWPCPEGSCCKCENCRIKNRAILKNRRLKAKWIIINE